MRQLLNTLFVQTERSYIHLDHDTLRVEVERETRLQLPLLQLSGIVCFGDVLLSPALLHRCAEDGRSVTLLDRNGRFKGRLEGPTSGNVLLRRAQHLALSDPERRRAIARNLLAGKLRNARQVLTRGSARRGEHRRRGGAGERGGADRDDDRAVAGAGRPGLDARGRGRGRRGPISGHSRGWCGRTGQASAWRCGRGGRHGTG